MRRLSNYLVADAYVTVCIELSEGLHLDAYRWVLELLRQSYIYPNYDFSQQWTLDEARLIVNEALDIAYKLVTRMIMPLRIFRCDCFLLCIRVQRCFQSAWKI